MILPLLFLPLIALADIGSRWQHYLSTRLVLQLEHSSSFPDSQLLLPWLEGDFALSERAPAPESLTRVEVNCAEKTLWALHPYQETKDYLGALRAAYDHLRLSVDSPACTITESQRRNYFGKFCPRATEAHVVFMSDTYQDRCGNTYRGYWLTTYLSSDENMGTLVSKGRTVYERSGPEFGGDFVSGYTYPVEASQFLFLTPLWSQDGAKVQSLRTKALREGFVLKGFQFWAP